MKVFLTGATGFIGSALMKSLIEDGHVVHALVRPSSFEKVDLSHPNIIPFQGDLLDKKSIEAAMDGCQQLYHVAAYARVWARNPETFYRVNVEGTENVLQAGQRFNIEKAVLTSSAATLPSSANGVPVDEAGSKDRFETEYARTKYLAEQTARNFTGEGMSVTIVNPPRVFGPGLLSESNAVTKLVKWYIEGKWRVLPGDGHFIGNYVYVQDVVKGHRKAMKHGSPGERYIIGGENVSLKELFDLVGKVSGRQRLLLPVPLRLIQLFAAAEQWKASKFQVKPLITPAWVDNYFKDSPLTSRKAKEELGYRITPLKEALAQTVRWVQESE